MGFRPLTGINFNNINITTGKTVYPFPSPHGDKFQLHLFPVGEYDRWFPSPHGDKFQLKALVNDGLADSFRLLTGINFNAVEPDG